MFKTAAVGLAAAAVSLCGVAAAHSGGGGGHSGGGTHYVYVPILVYPGAPATPEGSPMEMPLELTDAPAQNTSGDMSPGDVIAEHSLRARDARVLLAPVNGRRGLLPAGTVLAWMLTPIAGLSVWCEIEARQDWLKGPTHDCLSEQDGHFVQLWVGESPSHFLASDSSVVRPGSFLPTPVAYRIARPQERPAGLMGFKWCEGDGVSGPPRFALAVTTPGDNKWQADKISGCRFGVWPDPADKTQVDVDGLKLKVSPARKSGDLTFAVAGRIAPVAELPPLVLARPAADVTPAPPDSKAASDGTLSAAGAPSLAATGEVAPGQVFLTLPVRHTLTGALRNVVHVHDGMGSYDLPVDQPLFGLPGHGPQEPAIIWCAPRQQPMSGRPGVLAWRTVCLSEKDGVVYAIEIPTAMMATALPWSKAREASPADVRTGPADLPPMTLSYVFLGFTDPALATRFARIQLCLDWGEGAKAIRSLSAPIGPEGAAQFNLLDGGFSFQPRPLDPAPAKHVDRKSEGDAQLAVTAPPKAVAPM